MVAWPLLAVALLTQAAPDTVLLDFYSDSCAPCRMMDPLVAQLVARGYPVRKVNVANEPQLAAQFNVDAVPTIEPAQLATLRVGIEEPLKRALPGVRAVVVADA